MKQALGAAGICKRRLDSQGIIIKIIAAVYEGFKVEGRQQKVAEMPLKVKLGFPVKF